MKQETVRKYMTQSPYSIESQERMYVAHQMMRQYGIRHLPVVAGGKVVGILSLRDIHLVESFPGVDPETAVVEEVMTPEPYVVPPEEPLESVVREMAEHKYGCAVIAEKGKLEGIFTTVDALNAFAGLLGGSGPRQERAAAERRAS